MMNIWQQVHAMVRDTVPFAVAVFLSVISALPFQVSGGAMVMPALSLVAFFYWRLVSPGLMPVMAGFVLGLLQDILSGTPVGLHALAYLLVAGVVASRWFGLFRESFKLMWLGFAVIASGLGLTLWIFYSLFNLHPISPDIYVIRLLITLFAFPPLVWTFSMMRRYIPG